VDLKKEVELREEAKEEEKKRILTDTAIRAADAYIRYDSEFIDYLLEALTTVQWDFYHRLTSKMKKRIPMLVTAKITVADICASLSSLLDLLLKYQEGDIHEGDELGQETEEI
jgi:ribosome-interacting GTPase 1